MFGLNDLFTLPPVGDLMHQVAASGPGLVLVAGLDPRLLSGQQSNRWLSSGRGAAFRILLGIKMESDPDLHGFVLGNEGHFKVPREFRKRLYIHDPSFEKTQGYDWSSDAAKKPGLLGVELLTHDTADYAIDAVSRGMFVLAQVDTARRGAGVVNHLLEMGFTEAQLHYLTWVVSVQRVATLCPDCRVEVPSTVGNGGAWFRSPGCRHCAHTGRRGEVMVFDVFRSDPASCHPLVQPSLLSARDYLLKLAENGRVSYEDVHNLDALRLENAYLSLVDEGRARQENKRALESKVVEMEVSNRILLQRTEALISLQNMNQTLTTSTSVAEVASSVCRSVCELCGADRSVVYLKSSDEEAKVLASHGWGARIASDAVAVSCLPRIPVDGEPQPYLGFPPGLDSQDEAPLPAGMFVPLSVQGVVGGWMIVQSVKKKVFQPRHVAMLRSFASQAALAIQRTRLVEQLEAKITALEEAQAELLIKGRMERELQLAHDVQQSVLPSHFPEARGLQFAAQNLPARQVGGDFYDVLWLDDDHTGILVADVSDKGMPAALFMALSRSLLMAEAHRALSPREVLCSVNRLLLELGESGMFVTVFYGVFDHNTHILQYARAGHDRPVVLRSGRAIELGGMGIVLGVVAEARFKLTEEMLPLEVDDRLLLFTDGLVDLQSPGGERFGHERLVELWTRLADLDVTDICRLTFDELLAYQAGSEQADDMTLLAVRVTS